MPRKPDFDQFLKVLRRERPDRPVMFEIGLSGRLTVRFADPAIAPDWSMRADNAFRLSAHANAGYDGCIVRGSDFAFPSGQRDKASTVSLNQGALITDRASFRAYPWPEPDDAYYSALRNVTLPDGMKVIPWAPGGVLENAISLVGFERLCMMLFDEPALAGDIFDAIGSRFVRYFEICAPCPAAGALMVNDDWGFKTQTMLSPADMRRHVIPWHKRIVDVIHEADKPALLHCCGNLGEVMDDVIDVIGYDAKHSFEDAIITVEEAYERWGGRIAILGGIDVDFLCRSTPQAIRERSDAMLRRAGRRGAYALGSGNSVPEYVPDEAYLAMRSAAVDG